uniref:Uridine phosphorylase, related n=1 Tax=Neospora caninum (strain Liverpool) TaxID=572307 RepID=A0A0F7UH48_NEOCL|nr:TPA: Uridine phosphorylase, related [Neospora caninum Liverpool]
MDSDYQGGGSSRMDRPSSRTSRRSSLVSKGGEHHAPHPGVMHSRERGVPSTSGLSSVVETNVESHSTSSFPGGSHFFAEGSAKQDGRSNSGSQHGTEVSSLVFETGDGSALSFSNACMGVGRSDPAQTRMSNDSSYSRSHLCAMVNRNEGGSSRRHCIQLVHDGDASSRDEKRPVFSDSTDFFGMTESSGSSEDTSLGRHGVGHRANASSCGIVRNCRSRETTNEKFSPLPGTGVGPQYPVPHSEDHSISLSSNTGMHTPRNTSIHDVLSSGGRSTMERVCSHPGELRSAAVEANTELSLSVQGSKRNFGASTGTSSFRSAIVGSLGYEEKRGGREREESSPRRSTAASVLTECQDDRVRGLNSSGGRHTKRDSYDSGVERDLARGTSGAKLASNGREKTADKEASWLPERRRSTLEEDYQAEGEASTNSKDRGMYPDEAKAVLRDALLLPSGHVYHLGYYKGTKVSIIATGMGAPMIELLMREVSYITDGPLAVVRLGTCSLLNPRLRPGCLVVATKGVMGCYNDYTYFDGSMEDGARLKGISPYVITRPCAPDPDLSSRIAENISKAIDDPSLLHLGLHASAETFYACQGRVDTLFNDRNEKLLDRLRSHGVDSMDMESHQLLHLANRRFQPVKAAAVHIGINNRTNDQFAHPVTAEVLNERVLLGGRACLDALTSIPM